MTYNVKAIYFSGKELELGQQSKKNIKQLSEKNPNIYQIIRLNRDQDIMFERDCPEE